MKIAFHTNQINLLGVEVSIFEYADLCEKLFGYKSIILSKNRSNAGTSAPAQGLYLTNIEYSKSIYLDEKL